MIRVLTIGYGGRTAEEVFALLQSNGVTHLVDVRTNPRSKFNPDFDGDVLDASAQSSGIKYVFMGDTLGGKPTSEECYDESGRVVYDLLRSQQSFKLGMSQLLKGASVEGRVLCLMCSEKKPEECHRSKLIGEELASQGVCVEHIIDETRLDPHIEVMARATGQQPQLFTDSLRSRKAYVRENTDA